MSTRSTTHPQPPEGFVHQAQIYYSRQDFVGAALPFVLDGVRAEELVLGRIKGANAAALRDALGDDIAGADIGPAEGWYENPSRTRRKFLGWVNDQDTGGGRIRLLGEPRGRSSPRPASGVG